MFIAPYLIKIFASVAACLPATSVFFLFVDGVDSRRFNQSFCKGFGDRACFSQWSSRVFVEVVEKIKEIDVEVTEYCRKRELNANALVSGAISDHQAFKIILVNVALEFSLNFILVDLRS